MNPFSNWSTDIFFILSLAKLKFSTDSNHKVTCSPSMLLKDRKCDKLSTASLKFPVLKILLVLMFERKLFYISWHCGFLLWRTLAYEKYKNANTETPLNCDLMNSRERMYVCMNKCTEYRRLFFALRVGHVKIKLKTRTPAYGNSFHICTKTAITWN